MKRILVLVATIAIGCARTPPLTLDDAKATIQQSKAFNEKSAVVFVDMSFTPGPNTRRLVLKIDSMDIRNDGPWGVAGKTARVAFTWRWTEGPLAENTYRSVATMQAATGGVWHVYEDKLREQIMRSERGDD